MPRVSIVIPSYNCDRYITSSIESILIQSYSDYEIIVVDDGSTDNTHSVLAPYFEKINYIYQTNQGVSTARNRGIQAATGDLIALLDADDFFLPNKLTDQVACFDAYPSVGLVHSGWQLANEQGQLLPAKQEPWLILPHLTLETWLLWRPVFPGSMMFRREWLDKANGFDSRFPPVEDVELVLRLSLLGCQAVWLPQVTVAYRQHSSSATTQNTLKQAKSFDAVYNHFFAQANLPQTVRQLEQAARYNYLVWLAWRLYYTGHAAKMAEYLRQSLKYTPYVALETVLNWVQLFRDYSSGSGDELEVCLLSNLPEWKQVSQRAFATKKNKISVIIPAYNCDRYIAQAIDSVLNQTFTDYDIIVVNDGSTDDTRLVLEQYGDRIHYIYQENQGAARARNRALQVARGEFVAFLDGDDLFLPDKLAMQMACFDADPALDMVQSGWRIINQDGKVISDVMPWQYAPRLDLTTFFLYKPVRPSAMLLRRKWCERVGGFNPDLPPTEDLEFCLHISLLGCNAIWLPEIHACYRQHDSNLMSGGRRVMDNTDKLIKNFLSRSDVPQHIHQLENQERYQRMVWFAWRMYRDGYPADMVKGLQESLKCTPFSPVETFLDWIKYFRLFSQEYGYELDLYSLINSEFWKQVTHAVVNSDTFYQASTAIVR